MTDKQIIIDGVDVSGCKNFYAKTKYCIQEDTIDTPCVDHPNCYYKKWKRKEQECEELKEEIKKHNDDMFKNPPEKRFYCKGCTLPYISKKLKTENDNLKETFDDLFKVQYKLADTNKKLRQCLTEIKEIAKKQCVCGVDCIDMKQILQKISECEGNDETTK